MTRKYFMALAMLFLLLLFTLCSVQAPELRVTGEKTALEREVIGTYERMSEDTWMIASSRSVNGGKKQEISEEKKRVLEALQQQKFNKDDIEEFKRKGYVGENNQGFLIIRNADELQKNTNIYKLVNEIVTEENDDREVIISRVVELNQNLKNAVQDNVMAIFAQMYQENSPVGTWVQAKIGDWVKK